MATIQKVSRYWRALFIGPDGKRVCRSLKTTDRSTALKMAVDLELAARAGQAGTITTNRARLILNEILDASGHAQLDTETTKQFCERWLAGKKRTKAENTGKRYGHVVREFLASLGEVAERPLAAVLPRHVEKFRDRLADSGRAPASLRLDVKIIGGIFALAVRQGLVSTNPAASIELDEAPSKAKEPFSDDEVAALLRNASPDWKTAILLGAFAGLRLGDAVNLTWEAVDFARGTLHFTPQKTSRKGRQLTVPLHPKLAAHLEAIAADEGGPICPTLAQKPTGGKTGLSRQFIQIMEMAGIDRNATKASRTQARAVSGKSFHSLRHYFNSALLAAGVDEKTRMDLSGHSTAAMNRKYSHAQLDTLRAAVGSIGW